jgi:F-box/leucine-rich repeat protein 14
MIQKLPFVLLNNIFGFLNPELCQWNILITICKELYVNRYNISWQSLLQFKIRNVENIYQLTSFTHIKHLSIVWMNLTDNELETITNLPYLEYLDLSGSNITDYYIKFLSKSIKYLQLSRCHIFGRYLSKLINLETLILDFCNNLLSHHIPILPKLKHLDITYCKKLIGIPYIASLEKLLFDGCEINNAEFPKTIKYLSMAGSNINNNLLKFTQLTHLNVSSCTNIDDTSMELISKITPLTNLNLSKCKKITDIGIKQLNNLTNLTNLKIASIQLTDVCLNYLPKTIEYLDISGCPFTKNCIETIKTMKKLKIMHMSFCPNLFYFHVRKELPHIKYDLPYL